MRVRALLWLIPLAIALIETVVIAVTFTVRTEKLLLVVPAGMLIDDTVGLATVAFDDERVTVILLGAAAASSVTVAVTVLPPVTVLGVSVTEATPIGRTLIDAALLTPA